MTKITVNGRTVDADPKRPLIAACHDNGIDVPMYCYHPGLTPVGSCRICQVEVKQGDGPARIVVACRTAPAEGMLVDTESPKAHETRRECLEFLLKNHPLDCPICDKAGECDLQDYSFTEGQSHGRSNEPRRVQEKRKSLGNVIVLDEERCILCSRCVRFFEEVPKQAQLTVADLGSRSVIATFGDRPLTGNYQGNIADICPVGALTLKQFRFQARVWNLSKHRSTCGECSRGCAISAEVLRGKEVKRFRPNYDAQVNQWWMCDVGRFSFERLNLAERLLGAERLVTKGWQRCAVEDGLSAAAEMLQLQSGALVVLSPWATVEEGEIALRLAARLGARAVFVSPPPSALKDDLLHSGDPCPNRRGLTALGIEGLAAEVIAKKLASAPAVLAGERVAELIGTERLARFTGPPRLVLFDERSVESPALAVRIGVPQFVEKTGHWVNVDGIERRLAVARSAPADVQPLARTLERLSELLAPIGAGGARD